ncbi:MAG: hypothetical protein FWG73_01760 [Planctomycetaceae bacterium]|nr:hypothetical protein [Planctomycetaceae bacterium]
MTISSEILMSILLFEGVAFILLAAVLVVRRFFRQPIDRIRLTQAGLGLVAGAAICIGCGIGPIWMVGLPVMETNSHTADRFHTEDRRPPGGEVQRMEPPASDSIAMQHIEPQMEPLAAPFSDHVQYPGTALHSDSGSLLSRSVPGSLLSHSDSGPVVSQAESMQPFLEITIASLLCYALILVPLVLFLRDFAAGCKLRYLLKHSACASEPVLAMFRQVSGHISGHARSAVRLRVSDKIAAPMVFGFLRPTLLLPERLCTAPVSELRACLVHEWSHLKNGDLLTWNVVRLFQYPLWMQPFYWMLRSRLLADQDYLADDDGAEACGETSDYARILLNFALIRSASEPHSALGMAGRKSLLKRRITMLFNEMRPVRKSSKHKLVLPFVLLAVLTLLGVGLRFGDSTEAVTATEPVNATEPGISVELTDADGNPCTTGYIRTYPNPRPADWEGNQPRNFDLIDGKCFVPIANFAEQRSFKIVLYPDGFAPYELRWPDTSRDPLPTMLSFKMPDRAFGPIGGRVIDAAGNPVADATISFGVSIAGRQNNPAPPILEYAQWFKTDADGFWIYQVLPPEQVDQNFDITITHPDFPRLRISKGQTFRDFAAKDADGRFTKTIVLPAGLPLKGRVLDEQGNPVVGAIIHTNAAQDDTNFHRHAMTLSGENGEFLFENCSPNGDLRTVDIGICHRDFAPDIVRLEEISHDMEPLNIVLRKGRTLIFKTVDPAGNPLEGMRISTRFWNNWWGQGIGTHRLFVDADEYGAVRTGEDGRFVWEHAPDGRINFIIEGDNVQNVTIDHATLKFGGEENVYVFKPVFEITGIVTDAETGEPIPNFGVSEWFTFKGSRGLSREFGTQSGRDGNFTRMIGQRFGEFDNYHLQVEADGYEALQSADLIAKSGDMTLEFKLKKATGQFTTHLIGTVLQPDGNPASHTEIGIATPGQPFSLENSRLTQNSRNRSFRTDSTGNFSISRSGISLGNQDYKLIFLHDSGFAAIRKAEFEQRTEPISLTPWGRIEGTIYTGTEPAKDAWASLQFYPEDDRNWDRPFISYFYRIPCDANGRFVFDRVFSGKGRVGQSIALNNDSSWHSSHMQSYDIEPGEMLSVKIGGGGYAVRGEIALPTEEDREKVDWRFASVQAELTYPERMVLPTPMIPPLMAYILKAPEMNTGWLNSPDELERVVRRWEALPESQAFREANPDLYEKGIQIMNAAIEWERQRQRAWDSRVTCVVDEHGLFQLDDLSPGDWTLEVTLNWPSVPGQFWDLSDTWVTRMSISVLDLPSGPPEEPMQVGVIPIGFEASDRRGPRR